MSLVFIGFFINFRFDFVLKEHVLDVIALIKTFRFPKTLRKFDIPEPQADKFRNLLMFRLELEKWIDMRTLHSQSDFSQYVMLNEKLSVCDSQIKSNYKSLVKTMSNMSKMITNLVLLFDPISTAQVQKLVHSIPDHLKKIVKNLEDKDGIIVKDADKIKLSPLFVENMINELKSSSLSKNQPKSTPVRPELIEELLNGFVNNSITARKKENKSLLAKRRQTWKQ
jgi:hypothetical protein